MSGCVTRSPRRARSRASSVVVAAGELAQHRVGARAEQLRGRELDAAVERDRQTRAEEPARPVGRRVGMAQLGRATRGCAPPGRSRPRWVRARGPRGSRCRGMPLRPRVPVESTSTLPSRRRSPRAGRPRPHVGHRVRSSGCSMSVHSRSHCPSLVQVTEIQPSAQRYVLIGAPRASALPVRAGMPIAA